MDFDLRKWGFQSLLCTKLLTPQYNYEPKLNKSINSLHNEKGVDYDDVIVEYNANCIKRYFYNNVYTRRYIPTNSST